MTIQSKWTIIASLLIVFTGTIHFSGVATAFETPGSILEFDAKQDVGGDAIWTNTGSSGFEVLTFVGGATPTASAVSDGTLNLLSHGIGADGVSNTFEQNLGGTVQASRRSATFEAWFKPNNLSTANQIILETGGTGAGMVLSLSNANLQFFANGNVNTGIATTLSNTNWHQVVGVIRNTFDSTANDFLELYLNGVFLGDTSGSLVDINDWSGGNQGGFGSFGGTVLPAGSQVNGGLDTGGVDLNGNLHLYRYYGRNLTSAEILANYNSVVNPATPWVVDANGNWNTAANWQSNPNVPGVGLLSGRDAILGTVATAPRTVTLNTNVNLSGLAFENSNQYTVAAGGGTMTLSGSAELRAVSGSHEIAAPIAGAVGLLKTGSGSLTLSGANSFTGAVGLAGGTLSVAANSALGNVANSIDMRGGTLAITGIAYNTINRAMTMTGNGTLSVVDASNSVNVSGALTGTGTLTKSGDGGMKLSNASTYNGNITVSAGELVVAANDGLGTSTGTTQVSGSGTIELDGSGGALTIAENFERLIGRTNDTTPHLRSVAGSNSLTGILDISATSPASANLENAASGTTVTINNTAGSPAKIWDETDQNATVRFQGTGNFKVGNEATPGSGKIVGDDVDVIVAMTDPTDTVTIATAIASTDTSNATGSYWRGDTIIESGRLSVLQDGINSGELVSATIQVKAGATFDVSNFTNYSLQIVQDPDSPTINGNEIGQVLSGAGTINTGAGRITAFEDSTIAPGDSEGILTVTGNMTINQSLANPNGALNYELSGSAAGTNDRLSVSNNLQLLADGAAGGRQFKLNVTPTGGDFDTATYTIISAGNMVGTTATATDFDVRLVNAQGTTLNSRQTPTLTVNATNVQVSFTAAQSHNWTGAVNGNWDVATTTNWSSSDSQFKDLDTVSFGNGTGQTAINIAAPVTPGGMNFNNTIDTYTFTGNSIQGSGAMNLAANTKVILANSTNGFDGGVNITAGATLTLGNGTGNNGQLAGGSNIVNNGTLIYNRNAYSFNSQVISGSGNVRVSDGYVDQAGSNSYSGGSTVNGGTLRLRNPSAAGSGGVIVNNGSALETGYFNNQSFSKAVTLNNGSTLSVTNPADSGVAAANSGQINWTSPITLGGTGGTVSTTAGDGIVPGMTVAGGITGSGNLTLSALSNRLLAVNSALTHSGNTTIAGGGTVALQASTAINSSQIQLKSNSKLDVTGTVSGALALSGQLLTGDGTVAGNVTTATSSMIRVGGVAGGNPFVTTGLQLHYDAAQDASGDNLWEDSESNAGAVNLDFSGGATVTVPASDPTFTALTAAYDIGASGGALSPGASNAYFDSRGTSNGTFELVFKVTNTSAGSEQVLLDIGATQGVSMVLNGAVLSAGVNGDAPANTGFFTGSLSTGWHHAVVVIGDTDPENGSNDAFSLYVDNSLIGTSSTVDIDDYAGSNGWGIGGANTGVNDPANGSNQNLLTPIDYHGQIAIARYYQSAFSAGDVNTNFLSLQGAPFVDVDTFNVDGNLTLDITSSLAIDIFDTDFGSDLLSITGNLAAAGTLNVSLAGSVGLGDSFDILDFATSSGSFGSVNLPSLGGGLGWDTSSLLIDGVLTVVTASSNGDFDMDGDVDGRDFLLWQRGGSPTPFSSSDLATWQANYGAPLLALSTAASSVVPEPASLVLLLVGTMALTQGRRRI